MDAARNRTNDRAPRYAGGDVRMTSDAAVTAVRTALQAHLRAQAPSAELGRVLRLVSAEARRSGLPVEAVLVVIKTAWSSIPEARQGPRTGLRDDALDRIVSLCIEEFYATPAGRAS
jgi:hypothetical protein